MYFFILTFICFGQKEPIKAQIFRLLTAHNQILYVIFQTTSQFSFKFCITIQCRGTIALKFSSWNICFGLKESMNLQFCKLLSAPMKFHPIPHVIFETTRSGFIWILDHCSLTCKIAPMWFFSSILTYLGQEEPIEVKFSDFWVVGWKFTKFLMPCLKPQVRFSLNFESLFSVMWYDTSILF